MKLFATALARPARDLGEGVAMAAVRLLLILFFGNPLKRLFERLDALMAAFRAGKLVDPPASKPAPPREHKPRAARARTPSEVRRAAPAVVAPRQHRNPVAWFAPVVPFVHVYRPAEIERPPRPPERACPRIALARPKCYDIAMIA